MRGRRQRDVAQRAVAGDHVGRHALVAGEARGECARSASNSGRPPRRSIAVASRRAGGARPAGARRDRAARGLARAAAAGAPAARRSSPRVPPSVSSTTGRSSPREVDPARGDAAAQQPRAATARSARAARRRWACGRARRARAADRRSPRSSLTAACRPKRPWTRATADSALRTMRRRLVVADRLRRRAAGTRRSGRSRRASRPRRRSSAGSRRAGSCRPRPSASARGTGSTCARRTSGLGGASPSRALDQAAAQRQVARRECSSRPKASCPSRPARPTSW